MGHAFKRSARLAHVSIFIWKTSFLFGEILVCRTKIPVENI